MIIKPDYKTWPLAALTEHQQLIAEAIDFKTIRQKQQVLAEMKVIAKKAGFDPSDLAALMLGNTAPTQTKDEDDVELPPISDAANTDDEDPEQLLPAKKKRKSKPKKPPKAQRDIKTIGRTGPGGRLGYLGRDQLGQEVYASLSFPREFRYQHPQYPDAGWTGRSSRIPQWAEAWRKAGRFEELEVKS